MLLQRNGEPMAWELGCDGSDKRWRGIPARRTLANAPDLLMRLARGGAGITAVSDFFAEPYVQTGELVRVLPGWCMPTSHAWAVFPGRRLMPAKTRVFIDALVQALQPAHG